MTKTHILKLVFIILRTAICNICKSKPTFNQVFAAIGIGITMRLSALENSMHELSKVRYGHLLINEKSSS